MCNCRSIPIRPGDTAEPFIDYQEAVAELTPAGQRHAMGSSNWALVESGKAKWEDVVTPGRIRDFREVADRLHLGVEDMVKAGVARSQAVKAYDATHTAAHRETDAVRASLVAGLRAHGLDDRRIVAEVSALLSKRFGVIGPGDVGLPPPVAPAPRPAPAGPTMAGSGGLAAGLVFARSEAQARRKDVLVLADVAKLDASLAADEGGFYVGPGGMGPSAVKGRYAEARRFMERARDEGRPVHPPEVSVGEGGQAYIEDGRHRFAALRDSGAVSVPVAIARGLVARFRKLFGFPTRPGLLREAGAYLGADLRPGD